MKPHFLLIAFCLSLSACDKPEQASNDTDSTQIAEHVTEKQQSNAWMYRKNEKRDLDLGYREILLFASYKVIMMDTKEDVQNNS